MGQRYIQVLSYSVSDLVLLKLSPNGGDTIPQHTRASFGSIPPLQILLTYVVRTHRGSSAMKSETPELCGSVNNTAEVLCSLPVDYQFKDTHVHDASNIGLRKQPQNFDLSVDFQGHQVEVPPQKANSPAPQSRDDTCGLTAEAPAYDATQLNRSSCRPATRLAKKPNRTTIRTRRSRPYGERQKQAASRPQDIGGRFLSRDEQAKISINTQDERQVATERPCDINGAMLMSFYGEEELENLNKRFPTSRL